MTDALRRGDPFDGLSGAFALWIALTTWIEAMAGSPWPLTGPAGASPHAGALPPTLALDAFLMICGLMAARAAREGLSDAGDLPRFAFWRALRFGPSLLVGAALFIAAKAALGAAGLATAAPYFAVNGGAAPLLAVLAGAIIIGAATVAGALNGAIGRAGLAAFAAACVAARLTPGMELSPASDTAARIAAALALGCFLDSIAASGRIARAIRRLKTRSPGGVELAALLAIVAAFVLTPTALLPAAPFAIAGYFLLFTRMRGCVADGFFRAPAMLEFGRAAAPMVGCSYLITWPVTEYVAATGTADLKTAVILSPIFILAVFGLAFAIRRLAEDPMRALAARLRRRVAKVRAEIVEEGV